MKRLLILLAFVIASGFVTSSFGQSMKIGYIYPDTVLQALPEYKAQQSKFQDYEKQLTAQLEAKQKDFETKLTAYQQGAAGWNDVVRQDKEAELQRLDQNLREFQQRAQIDLRNKEVELLEPLYVKIQNAVEDLAESSGYDFIARGEVFMFAKSAHNLTSQVITKLGGSN